MVSYDLVVKGGTIVTSSTTFEADVLVDDGKIISLRKLDTEVSATTKIDARNMFILPGLIDSHVHFRDPGMTHKEDFETGSRGAIAGGVTTVFDMPTTQPVVTTADRFQDKLKQLLPKSLTDFGLYGAASPTNSQHVAELAKAGVIAFKTYTVAPPSDRVREYEGAFVTDDGQLLETMEAVAKTHLLHCIHAENDSTIRYLTEKLRSRGRYDALAHHDSRPSFTETEAVFEAITLARIAGVRLHILHMSTGEAAELVRQAKARGVPVTAETCPHYLLLSKAVLEKHGAHAKINPPPRTVNDQESLWRGLGDKSIDMVVSDHAPHTKEEKEAGKDDIWKAPPGTPGVETRLPLLLTSVKQGRITLNDVARLASENVAKVFNLFPTKGSLTIGADADMTIINPKEEWMIRADKLQTKAWQTVLFDGWPVHGKVKYTVLRGRVVYEDDVGFGKTGVGAPLFGRTG